MTEYNAQNLDYSVTVVVSDAILRIPDGNPTEGLFRWICPRVGSAAILRSHSLVSSEPFTK
jgi:hypothetical protein